jgi:two-component system OmpR family response regulator
MSADPVYPWAVGNSPASPPTSVQATESEHPFPASSAGGRRVLVVDDEESITELVAMALRYEGFAVETAATGYQALSLLESFRPELVILDVMLPDIDGFNIAERLRRERRNVPVLFLTARDATEDKVRGLTIGGDDYVTKPFSVAELVARVQAVMRRASGTGGGNRLVLGDLEMDDDAHEVRRAGRLIELTATEYRLLRYLLANARRVLTRAQLLDHVWNYDFGGDAGVLETYISYLRKKVDFTEPRLIHTVRGVGYVLRPPRS